jgi:transposase-like protein
MKAKQLWKGIFNFSAGIKREYAFAYTKKQATLIIVKRIADHQGVDESFLFDWMKQYPSRYTIKLEMEYTEAEDADDHKG